MLRYLLSALSGAIFLLLFGFMFISWGGLQMDTKSAPFPLEKFFARRALRASIGQHVNDPSPMEATEPALLAGAKLYRQDCAVCHGLPRQPKSAIAAGMFPRPPQLFVHTVDDDPIGETFWKVKHGIRLSGMPGFEGQYTDTELWQVSLLLKLAGNLPKAVQDVLAATGP